MFVCSGTPMHSARAHPATDAHYTDTPALCTSTVQGLQPHTLALSSSSQTSEGQTAPNRLLEGDSAGGLEKICRQLTHHLSPHSQCKRQGFLKRKPQACLKAALSGSPPSDSVDLSGIALTVRDLQRVALYLQRCWETVCSVELGFTELTDEGFLQLLPTLASLPNLCNLSLNGNKLTRAILRELTDTLKDLEKFPSITWIDLGNNVDIYSLPQPFLVSLRRRCPKHGNLPTILEFAESQGSDLEDSESDLCGQLSEGAVPDQKPLLDMAARCDGSEGEGAAGETGELAGHT
ncbi:leucine-rich repeat-containing protein 75A-like isoform X3 [Pristis pectinata]|uniref:leucine-rich repeat-containing protein 75A-like isoform X3 n=1 Tax=Pristis pectinata TaxID=685728 RepID=UPI00223CC07C|nr:leucine-rich repeat-containing protein 75A-like isoform X3 [Pristis pectinata]